MTIEQATLLLPGMQEDFPEAFYYLARLVGQDQFELIGDKAVYLMNDAAESYLHFINLTQTGALDEEYEDHLEAHIEREESGRYALVIRQDANVSTLFFDDLKLVVNLYDYSKLGHFWVKGYEYLRRIEYQIAIANDKREYLGEEYCTQEERKLTSLVEFPPLNYCCYPAASMKYVVPQAEEWEVSLEACDLMKKLAAHAGDKSLYMLIEKYKHKPTKRTAKKIAYKLHRKKHQGVVSALESMIRTGASSYPDRKFPEETERMKAELKEKALKICEEQKAAGREASIVFEEPFAFAADGIELAVYVMSKYKKFGNIKTEIIEIK